MPQPPLIPIIAHENVRFLPSLSQKTFQSAAAGAAATFIWEFDLALRITDPNQFLNANIAPANSTTIAGGGPGTQTTPQPAIGPFADVGVVTSGAGGGQIKTEIAVDASPCNYQIMSIVAIPASTFGNISGLRVTGRFVRFTFTNISAGAVVEVGFFIRNT